MGVPEVVEHERPAGRVVAVGPHGDAVVRALPLARVGDGRRCRAEREADERRGPRRPRAARGGRGGAGARRRRRASTTPVPTISVRTGTTPSSTYPVRNVPTSAPAVPIADSRPTSEPLDATSVIVARTSIGATAARIAAGSVNATRLSRSPPSPPVPARTGPSSPTIGTLAIAASPPRTNVGPSRVVGGDAVREPAAGPRPERDAREDDPDDRGVDRQRVADERRHEPGRGDLDDEDRGGGDEREHARGPGAERGRTAAGATSGAASLR